MVQIVSPSVGREPSRGTTTSTKITPWTCLTTTSSSRAPRGEETNDDEPPEEGEAVSNDGFEKRRETR